MNWRTAYRMLAVAVVTGLFMGTVARAQDQGGSEQAGGEAQATLQAVQAELASLKAELQAVRAELQKVQAELALVKAQAKAAPPAPRQPPPPDTTIYNIDLGDSPIRGPKDAPVTIVEFASFACGWCVKEDPTIKKVMEAYPKDVRFVLKNHPMWPTAQPAHAATVLALKQKGEEAYWKMHDLIIEGGAKKLTVPDLRGYAEQLGMDLAEFDSVMADAEQVKTLATKDAAAATACKVSGTPSIYINGLKLSGQRTFENYKARIDAILQEKGKPTGA